MQQRVLKFYTHPVIAWGVAVIIVVNFLINIVEKEIDPIPSKYPGTWASFELAFNIIFLLELLINMYGQGGPFKPFWSSGWNVFDTIIVSVGVVLMTGADLGPFNKLKLLRAFRIFRLFKRIKSLNKILVAIAGSLRGVANALVIMLIFMCIYAILAVDLFHGFGSMDGTYMTSDIIPMPDGSDLLLNTSVTSLTARGMHHFSEYYGTFFRAFYTLFQVMTGESWSEACARPLLFGLIQNNGVQVGVFYVSYIMLMQFVMMNVVIAVLLMGMDPGAGEEEQPTTAVDDDDDHKTDEQMLGGEGGPAALTPSPSAPPKGWAQPPVAPPAAAAAPDDVSSPTELGGEGESRQVAPGQAANAEPSDAELAVRVEQTLDAILFELGIMQKDAATQGVELKTLKREQSGRAASERGRGAEGLVVHPGPDRSKPNTTLEKTTRPRLNLEPMEAHQPEASLLESSQRFLSELVGRGSPILNPVGTSQDEDVDKGAAAMCKPAAAAASSSASELSTVAGSATTASQPSTRTPACSVRNRLPRTNLGTNRSSGSPVKTVQV